MSTSNTHYQDGPEPLLVKLAQNGDEQAFTELLQRRQSWVRNLLRRCCGNVTLADDLAQQVFLQTWRSLKQIKDPTRFGGWLRSLTVNTWLAHQRRKDPLFDAADCDTEQAAAKPTPGLALDLDKALATLKGPVRLCIVLSYHEQLSHAEIAELTAIPTGTVKSHIRRGTSTLREVLSAYNDTSRESLDEHRQ